MLLTSSVHHLRDEAEWLRETRELMSGLSACEMALTLAWVARLGAEALVDQAGDAALDGLKTLGLALEEARSGALSQPDVRD